MTEIKISELLNKDKAGKIYKIKGWIRTARQSKNITFLEINDGSVINNLQIILEEKNIENYESLLDDLTTGSSIEIEGLLIESPAKGQEVELSASRIKIIGKCPSDLYPLQKKRHSFEYLRSILHLRSRTNTQGAVVRIRSTLSFSIHKFFQERGFLYIQTPIITGSDCEGAGEMFRVTTLDLANIQKNDEGLVDYNEDFFGKQTFLTVSGQLNVEPFCCSLGNVYTFGPTFRAEKSNTSRHCSEFWMIEPEIAFAGLKENMELAEDCLKYIMNELLILREEDLNFLDKWVENGLITKLKNIVNKSFKHITYAEAIDILANSKQQFEYPVFWGTDLQAEHERYITEKAFDCPVIVTNYPKEIKAFYMRLDDDEKTVSAMDVLVPGVGEIVGGSVREEREDVLIRRIKEMNLNIEDYIWYLELRKFGTIPHAGFGLGFDRLVQYSTGMTNIRDVIPYPRTPKNALF
ncbi:MAG: asparagine--tRNA ligase [Candidatus Coatesbacteria bacterium]|nr:asparagine--tRNA ligase [Candidatus Coatesbacteria bacterium]